MLKKGRVSKNVIDKRRDTSIPHPLDRMLNTVDGKPALNKRERKVIQDVKGKASTHLRDKTPLNKQKPKVDEARRFDNQIAMGITTLGEAMKPRPLVKK